MTTAKAFRGFRFPADVILRAVRWHLQFPRLRCKDRLRARDGLILWPGQAEIPNRRLVKRASLPPPTASVHSLNWPFLNIRII
jgi:hypothetical protein